jgi:hypothetical protein
MRHWQVIGVVIMQKVGGSHHLVRNVRSRSGRARASPHQLAIDALNSAAALAVPPDAQSLSPVRIRPPVA